MNSFTKNSKLNNFKDFIQWERTTNDTIDVKRCYIDMTNDLIAGILLSQIVYWHLPNKKSQTKLRVIKRRRYWLVKDRKAWWQECRITPKQFDRAINILKEMKLVHIGFFRFNGLRTMHIALDEYAFVTQLNLVLYSNADLLKSKQRHNSSSSKGNVGVTNMSTPLTESTYREYVPNSGEEYLRDSTNDSGNLNQDIADAIAPDAYDEENEEDNEYDFIESDWNDEFSEEAEGIDGEYTDTAVNWRHSQEEANDV